MRNKKTKQKNFQVKAAKIRQGSWLTVATSQTLMAPPPWLLAHGGTQLSWSGRVLCAVVPRCVSPSLPPSLPPYLPPSPPPRSEYLASSESRRGVSRGMVFSPPPSRAPLSPCEPETVRVDGEQMARSFSKTNTVLPPEFLCADGDVALCCCYCFLLCGQQLFFLLP